MRSNTTPTHDSRRAGRVSICVLALVASLLFWARSLSALGKPRDGGSRSDSQNQGDEPSLLDQLPTTASQLARQRVRDFDLLRRILSTKDYDRYLELFTDFPERVSAIKNYYPKAMWPNVIEELKESRVHGLYDQVYCYFDQTSRRFYLSSAEGAEKEMWSLPWAAYFLVPNSSLDLIEFRQLSMGDATAFLKLEFHDRAEAPLVRHEGYGSKVGSGPSPSRRTMRLKDMTVRLDIPGPYVDEALWRHNLREAMFEFKTGVFVLLDDSYFDESEGVGP